MPSDSSAEEVQWLEELAVQPDLDSSRAFLARHPSLICKTTQLVMHALAARKPDRTERERLEAISDLVRLAAAKGLDKAYAELSNAQLANLHPFELLALGSEFLATESDRDAWSMLREYPKIDLAIVRPLAQAAAPNNEGAKARIQQRLSMLEHKPELGFQELLHGAAQAEQMLKSDRSIENLRMCSVISDAIAGHDLAGRLPPAERANLLNHCARYHYSIWLNTYELDALNGAIEQGAQAERLTPGISTFLYTSALVERYESQGNVEDLNAAITAAAPFLPNDQFSDTDEDAAQLASNLANALRHQFTHTGSIADIERAVALYERLVRVPGTEPRRNRVRLLNLSAGFASLYDAKGDLADLNRSISIAVQCLNETPDSQHGKSTLANNVGMALQNRYLATSDESDLRAALDMHLLSVQLAPAGAPEVPRNLTNCGACQVMAYRKLGDRAFLDDGIASLRKAIELLPQGESEAGRPLLGLSGALMSRFEITDAREDIDEAISLAMRCRDTTSPSAALREYALTQVAKSLVARSESAFAGPRDSADATTSFRESLKIAGETSGIGGVETAVSWGAWARRHERWSEAAEAFVDGLMIHRGLVARQNSRETRELRIHGIQGLGAMAASALIRCERLQDAVVTLEQGRGVSLAQGLKRRPQDFDLSEIARRAGASALVYLENIAGGFALIVRNGNVRALELPMFREEYINTWLANHLDLRLTDPAAFETKLSELCRWLWDAGIGELMKAVSSCEQITLIPGGYLGMLPLHAAWTEDASTPTGRKYFMDCVGIRYAPTALALGEPHRAQWKSMLCIDDPQPTDSPLLPFSEAETRAASRALASSKTLRAEAATKQATLKALPAFNVAHFSCHGRADLVEPLKSGLLLSNNELLTLADLFGLDLTLVDLVVLSACDTAQMGTYLPDEVISLPSGMLQAGVTGVITPLWPIDSFGTLLMLARFYELLAEANAHASEAMRQAQWWLRDTTNEEKAQHFISVRDIWRPLQLRDPKARDFASISDFAAFTYTGA